MSDETLKCPICAREFSGTYRKQALRGHLMQGHKIDYSKKKKEKEQPKCDHKYRLLNSIDGLEKNAMLKGYMEVCEKCQEVR